MMLMLMRVIFPCNNDLNEYDGDEYDDDDDGGGGDWYFRAIL